MNNSHAQLAPADGIRAIECSVQCFAYGLASLVPLIGFPMALAAFGQYAQVLAITKGGWTPGRRMLSWGRFLSCAGMVISVLTVVAIIATTLQMWPWQYSTE